MRSRTFMSWWVLAAIAAVLTVAVSGPAATVVTAGDDRHTAAILHADAVDAVTQGGGSPGGEDLVSDGGGPRVLRVVSVYTPPPRGCALLSVARSSPVLTRGPPHC